MDGDHRQAEPAEAIAGAPSGGDAPTAVGLRTRREGDDAPQPGGRRRRVPPGDVAAGLALVAMAVAAFVIGSVGYGALLLLTGVACLSVSWRSRTRPAATISQPEGQVAPARVQPGPVEPQAEPTTLPVHPEGAASPPWRWPALF